MSMKCFSVRFSAFVQLFILAFLSVPFVSAQKNAPQTVFSNTTPVTINSVGAFTSPSVSTPYGSTIEVSGMTGTITKVEVSLRGISHLATGDLDFLLVSPTGAKFVFLSDAPSVTVEDQVFTFSDTAATVAGSTFSGTYLPTNFGAATDIFPAPAPTGPYSLPPATFASVFNGANPNGTWTLYGVDDTPSSSGSLNSGWSLNITTDGAPATFTNPTYLAFFDLFAVSSPYGTSINVSGQTGVVTNLKVTLNGLTHTRIEDVDILLVSPNGRGVVIMSDAGSGAVPAPANLTFDDSAVPSILGTIVSGTFRPTDDGFTPDTFFSPAPLRPYFQNTGNNQLSNFNGFSPNGDWRLFIVDDTQVNSGNLTGGWSLDITTGPPPPPPPLSCSVPTFATTNFPVGINPTNMALADFNNDGKTDLAVTNQVSNDVSILSGNGDGTFGAQTVLAAGSGPYSIVAGKFNADNNFDLAVVNSGSNNVSILTGNGNGTFSAPTNFFVGASPLSITAGDINNDSKVDLVVANFGSFFSGAVSILIGNGNGGFTNGTSLRTRTQPSFVTLANLNADANLDLVVANFGSDSVSTYFGNGGGLFVLQQNITSPGGPVALELADFGADGINDLAIANYNFDTVRVCTGSANGTFGSCSDGNAGGFNPISLTSADFTGSGIKTWATALSGSNSVNVLTSAVSVGQNPNAVESADFNGDGKTDLVAANSGSNDVTVMLSNCQVALGNIFDYDGDRKTDYSTFRPNNANYFVRPLNPGGLFRNFGRPTDKLVPADYDGDRKIELAHFRPESGLWIINDQLNKPVHFQQFGLANDIPVPADFDGDGKADIAVWRPSDGTWYVRRSSDHSLQINQFGSDGDKPTAADFDGDGKADLGIFRPSTGVWYIWRSSDNGFFITQFGIAEDKTVVGDYDGDGKSDIAVWRPSTGVWYVLKSSDGGFFAAAFGLTGDVPMVGDFEGDGKFDYAVFRPSEGNWYALKSSDNGLLVFTWGMSGDIPIPSAFVR